jgi:hypothetical protein
VPGVIEGFLKLPIFKKHLITNPKFILIMGLVELIITTTIIIEDIFGG